MAVQFSPTSEVATAAAMATGLPCRIVAALAYHASPRPTHTAPYRRSLFTYGNGGRPSYRHPHHHWGQKRRAALRPPPRLPDGDRFVVIVSNWGQSFYPAWYHDLRAHPSATLSYIRRANSYVAREASGDKRERQWQMATWLSLSYDLYKQRSGGRPIPVIVLTPAAH